MLVIAVVCCCDLMRVAWCLSVAIGGAKHCLLSNACRLSAGVCCIAVVCSGLARCLL